MRWVTLREGCLLALDQLRTNKFRSTMTVLGIVVGVTTVMAMSSMITGIRSSVMTQLDAAGPENFIVSRFDFNNVQLVGGGGPSWRDNPKVTADEAERIAALPAVRTAIVDFDAQAEFAYGSERLSNVALACDGAGWAEFTKGSFVAGHDFLPADVRASRPVVVLSKPLADELFGTLDPVGRTVRMNGAAFRVVGVFELEGNVFADVVQHFAVVPYTAATKHLNVSDEMLGVLVVTADHATQAEAMDQVIGRLRTLRGLRPGEDNDFVLIRQDELLATFNRLTGVFFLVMIALSSVALMVGGVGVVAIMMIAVTERTREIGVRKALGATRREILWQFLIEAASMTVIGGAIGMLIGAGIALAVQALTPIPAAIPLWAVAAALGMAAVAGIAFGMWPAWRAARLDPVVALRYE